MNIVAALQRMVRRMVAGRLDALAAYPCKIVSQSGDGTLSLVPDSPRVPAMTDIPIRYGIPGVTAKVRPGARVLLSFENGDPEFPVATVWDSASVSEIKVVADKVIIDSPNVRLNDGDLPIARAGDAVAVLITPAIAASLPTATTAIPITGTILNGSSKARSK